MTDFDKIFLRGFGKKSDEQAEKMFQAIREQREAERQEILERFDRIEETLKQISGFIDNSLHDILNELKNLTSTLGKK